MAHCPRKRILTHAEMHQRQERHRRHEACGEGGCLHVATSPSLQQQSLSLDGQQDNQCASGQQGCSHHHQSIEIEEEQSVIDNQTEQLVCSVPMREAGEVHHTSTTVCDPYNKITISGSMASDMGDVFTSFQMLFLESQNTCCSRYSPLTWINFQSECR